MNRQRIYFCENNQGRKVQGQTRKKKAKQAWEQ